MTFGGAFTFDLAQMDSVIWTHEAFKLNACELKVSMLPVKAFKVGSRAVHRRHLK
jgi:hypothetical protein